MTLSQFRSISLTRLKPKLPHKQVWRFLQSRLSQRIALSVFGSIVAIEAIILVPSVYRREQELLTQLADQSSASLMSIMAMVEASAVEPSPQQLLQQLTSLEELPLIVGGSLYHKAGPQAGQLIGQFGSAPGLTYAELEPGFQGQRFHRRLRRYDSAWVSPIADDYVIIICHDTEAVRAAVVRFIGNISGLVLIISGVVTLATMIVLRPLLIKPILELRQDLLNAAPAALQSGGFPASPFASRFYGRTDELGEVQQAFEQMFTHISGAIAQRQKAEAKLRESESRFRALVDQAAESILVLDRQGKILDANQFALHYLGYSDLKNNSVFDINPDFTPQKYRAYWHRMQSDSPITVEAIHRCKDGRTYPVEIRSSLIRKDGEQRVLSLVRDISDRKKAQASQARLAEIGELAAMIVHEVRNPLATIYMALTGFGRLDLPPAGQLRLELAMEDAERLKRLLDEILNYSKEQRLQDERVDIDSLCLELKQSLQALPVAQDRDIRLISMLPAVTVLGDRDKLKQVFINLVTNACEAIAPFETVTWTLQALSEHQIKIDVHNGGDPIPPELLPKLAQPFVSTKDGGNGLGLAITKRIIEAHGGSLAIASYELTGTTFTVLLPVAPAG